MRQNLLDIIGASVYICVLIFSTLFASDLNHRINYKTLFMKLLKGETLLAQRGTFMLCIPRRRRVFCSFFLYFSSLLLCQSDLNRVASLDYRHCALGLVFLLFFILYIVYNFIIENNILAFFFLMKIYWGKD